MTDFEKWDRFDADAAEKEIERKAVVEEAKRVIIAEEQLVLKYCQDRAARLKSEAVVSALKAKRGSRRRSATTTEATGNTEDGVSLDGAPKNVGALVARTSADEAHAILKGLRRGLELRDEIVADAEAGNFHRGTRTARECLVELSAAQKLLGKVVAVVSPGDTGDNHGSATQGAAGATGGTCCGHGGHDHAHAHAHHGHAHSVDTGHVGQGCASDSGGGVRGKSAATGVPAQADGRENDEPEEIPKALEVLRRAKAACRVAEAACLLRGGRVAQSTEVLRELLFEDSKSVAAWVARGESFLAMNAPLLAGLHFDRALELDKGCVAAATHKQNLRHVSSKGTSAASAACADESHQTPAAAGDTDAAPQKMTIHHGSPTNLSSRVGCGGNVGDQGSLAVAGDVGVETPAPAEDGAIFTTEATEDPAVAAETPDEEGNPGVAPTAAASSSAGGDRAAARGVNDDGGSVTEDVRRFVAAACEDYRAGVVLHQEGFLSSSRQRFLRVLEALDKATAAGLGMHAAVARQDKGGESAAGQSPSEKAGCGDGCEGLDGKSEEASSGSQVRATSKCGGERGKGGHAVTVVRNMRVGCHLNIAASFLLRKTDLESAAIHCTRALVVEPGNSRALVRRAQAHQELGYFRLAVEDLEAAEASVLASVRDGHRRGEGSEALAGELAEVVKRLEHARWTKVHVGNGNDELPRV
ncbi:conserved unknown protein [Ectocarpus siliculosus]|uniref:Uncharacterized protein n=1 Tax=Ectocarpus siliculosus TaxID=2880 RepID=D8LB22_ECTSI|nr:conserved unknown protein [Ectocarpus siliculosus]|eukprot:CBN76531.1 conserved unknown protein [Ectocarpus siliculosus]